MNEIEQDLLDNFDYNANTGILTRINAYHPSKEGEIVGKPDKAGYLRFIRRGKYYLVEHFAILHEDNYLPKFVQHINSIKTDNRYSNLIDITFLKQYSGEINKQYLNDIFDYNKNTGILSWKYNLSGPIEKGMIAGSLRPDGYRMITIRGNLILEHRLIWLYIYGYEPDQIDHINHDRSDNRLENLREVTAQENSKNRINTNQYGINGMIRLKSGNWNPCIGTNYKTINLGTYTDFFEACCARKSAENKYNYYDNNGHGINKNYYNSRIA